MRNVCPELLLFELIDVESEREMGASHSGRSLRQQLILLSKDALVPRIPRGIRNALDQ